MRRAGLSAILSAVVFALTVLAGPKLAVSELVYDFGEVKEGILVVHNFVLTNVGDSVLTLRPPSTSCGCTTAPLPKTSLLPGESMALEVRFETTGYGGHQVAKYVHLYSEDAETPRLMLTIQGYVAPCAPYEDTVYMLRYRYRVVLDVRDQEAFARGHLLGATNVPLAEIEKAISWLPASTIYYICDEAGETELSVAETLRRHGFWAARVLSGGLAGWAKEFGGYLVVGEVPSVEPKFSSAAVPASRMAQEYLIILDFRGEEAYIGEHLVGAIHVRPAGLEAILDYLLPAASLAPELQPYIFCVDEGEGVAQEAAQFLQALGLSRAYAVVGGLPQWRIRYGAAFMILGTSG